MASSPTGQRGRRPFSAGFIQGSFAVPAMLLMIGLVLYPVVYGLVISLFDTNLLQRWRFVGLGNYSSVLADPGFLRSLLLTAVFTVIVIAGNMLVGIWLALCLNKPFRGVTLVRAVLIFPWLFPEVVVAMLWKWLLDPLYGLMSYFLNMLPFFEAPVAPLASTAAAMPAVAFTAIWKGYPLVMVMVLAGLQSINQELYEAAEIDGATWWQGLRYITLPRLRPVLLALLVLETIWWIKHFTIVWIMTSGGPSGSTDIVSIHIYRQAFENFRFGYAAASAVIVLILCVGISLFYQRFLGGDQDA